jgi:hypothetical protein
MNTTWPQYGWICPHCNQANAPNMMICCKGNKMQKFTTGDTFTLASSTCQHGKIVGFQDCVECNNINEKDQC